MFRSTRKPMSQSTLSCNRRKRRRLVTRPAFQRASLRFKLFNQSFGLWWTESGSRNLFAESGKGPRLCWIGSRNLFAENGKGPRLCWIRIRIRIQLKDFLWQILENITAELYIFNNAPYTSFWSLKMTFRLQEKLIFLRFSLFMQIILACMDPDSDPDPQFRSGSTDLIESGSETLLITKQMAYMVCGTGSSWFVLPIAIGCHGQQSQLFL